VVISFLASELSTPLFSISAIFALDLDASPLTFNKKAPKPPLNGFKFLKS